MQPLAWDFVIAMVDSDAAESGAVVVNFGGQPPQLLGRLLACHVWTGRRMSSLIWAAQASRASCLVWPRMLSLVSSLDFSDLKSNALGAVA